MPVSILRTAHGAAADGGQVLVAETPPLDELKPLNAADTAAGVALVRASGRPFTRGNRAAVNKGPSLTRVTLDPSVPEERRKVARKANSLKKKREAELRIQHGGLPLSSAVKVELVAWARATAWSEFYDRKGDAKQAAQLAEKASGHQLKAIAIAEREAAARTVTVIPVDPLAPYYEAVEVEAV